MSTSIYIAHRRKNAFNALNVPSTDQKDTSSVYDENSQFACPAYANCFWTSNKFHVVSPATVKVRRPYVSSWNRGTWRNEDAVVQQLERPVCTAQTDNLVPGHASTCTPSPQACMWLDLPHQANAAHGHSRSLKMAAFQTLGAVS